MRTLFPVIAIATAGAGGLLFACTVNSTTNNNGPTGDDAGQQTGDDSATPPSADSGADGDDVVTVDAAVAEAAAPQAFIRIAHWSPDAPAVDVCFTQAGAGWTGQVPQLAQIAAAADAGSLSDGGASGIVFPQVTLYLIISPDTYSVRLVAAGSADCTTSVVDLASVTIAANSYTTIAAVGEQTPVATDQALKLVSFTDEVSAPAGQVAIRFINASPSPSLSPVDVGTGSFAGAGGPFAALFTGVAFGQTGSVAGSDAGAIDANGYVASTPLATATLSAHPSASGSDATVALNDVTIAATSAATVALVNGISNGLASSTVKLLQCADADDSAGTSLLSTCSIISTQ